MIQYDVDIEKYVAGVKGSIVLVKHKFLGCIYKTERYVCHSVIEGYEKNRCLWISSKGMPNVNIDNAIYWAMKYYINTIDGETRWK